MTLTSSLPLDIALATAGSVLAWKLLGRLLRELVLVPKYTCLADLPSVGTRRVDAKFPGRAVICGGSVSGLLAAAVCAHHFESVLVIEPEQWANQHGDTLPESHTFRVTANGFQAIVPSRTRIMQYHALHFFQPPVYMILKHLFPTLEDEMKSLGISPRVLRLRFYYNGVYTEDPYTTENVNSGAPLSLSITREIYETLLRRLVKTSKSNVEIITGTVTGFKRAAGGSTLQGVMVRSLDGEETLQTAAMVVDATGPSQMSYTKWLKAAGFSLPPDLRAEYDPHLRYTTSFWTISPGLRKDAPGLVRDTIGVVYNHPADWKSGDRKAFYICNYEHDQLLLAVGGWDIRDRPHTIAGIREYVKSLNGVEGTPPWVFELFDFLEQHEDKCNPWYTDSTVGPLSYVKYHLAKDLPENFVVVGDAGLRLNPLYGQGTTLASLYAATLDGVLRNTSSSPSTVNVSRKYFQTLQPRIEGCWDATRANDYAFSTTKPAKGEDLNHGSFMRNFGRDVIICGQGDPEVFSVWWHVNMMLAPATDMFAPWFLFRVLKNRLFGTS